MPPPPPFSDLLCPAFSSPSAPRFCTPGSSFPRLPIFPFPRPPGSPFPHPCSLLFAPSVPSPDLVPTLLPHGTPSDGSLRPHHPRSAPAKQSPLYPPLRPALPLSWYPANAPFRQSKRETDRFRAGRPPFASSEPYSSWLFPVDFRHVGSPQNIIDADVIKIRQTNQRFRGRNPFPVFKLGEQGLLNPCFHLHGNLRVPSALTEQPQIIIHRIITNDIMSYFALDKYDIMSYTEYGFRNNRHF